MADARLERMRQMMRDETERKSGNRSATSNGGDKASYPYWNIPEKQTATVRFLPDKDDNNPWFWVERQTIKLPFKGIVGGEYETTAPQIVTVPCIDMFGQTCPIIAETRPWWKTNEARARRYWKKRSFIAQGFVVSSPFEENDAPENSIRRFIIGPSLLEKLKAGLVDPEMENIPTDYLNGTDFKIKKTRKSDYNNYDTSEWSRRTRPLSEAEQIAIERFDLFNLKDFLGAKPDADGVAMIKAMFHASVNNEPFDTESWGGHYRAWGVTGGTSEVDEFNHAPPPPRNTAYAPPPVTEERVVDVADEDGESKSPMELLDKLRGRVTTARA